MEQNPFLCWVEYDIPELADLPDACFDEEPPVEPPPEDCGEVAVRTVDGRLIPIRPEACPLHRAMTDFGVEPVCEIPGKNQCCTELGARTRPGAVQCGALLAPRPQEQPMVALIALQKREKLPPPHTLN